MDFNDTPEEAEYRARARAWLDENATRCPSGASENPCRSIVSTVPRRVPDRSRHASSKLCRELEPCARTPVLEIAMAEWPVLPL